jgi:hypothetical protein
MKEDAIFALKISGVELASIKPSDLAQLMRYFCQMLGDEHLSFDVIKTGSVYIQLKTPLVYAEEKTLNIQQAIALKSSSFKSLQQLANKHTDWVMDILSDSENDTSLYTFTPEAKKGFSFKQMDVIRGQLTRLVDGKDKKDSIGLTLESGKEVTIFCSNELSKALSTEFKNGSLIEIHGEAKYNYMNFNDIRLEEFEAHSFTVLEKMSMGSWLKGFIGDGQTGWSQIESPVEH